MGFLDRVIGAVNKVGTPIDSLTDTIGPSRYRKGEQLESAGRPVTGRIVGIERKLDDGTDTELFALEFTGPDEPVVAGARIRTRGMERLRLGMPVLLRVDDDRAVLDWKALCARWGIEFAEPAQRPLRSAPDPGVKDSALDMRVQRHLKKWTPARAKIVSFERRTIGGMATENWDVDLQLANGATTRAGGEVVPFYVSWLAAPGVEVPIVVDPKNPGKASVDWPAAAVEAADRAGDLDDSPPAGSIASAIEQDRNAPPRTVMSTTAPPTAMDPEVAPIEGVSRETWAAVEVGIGRDRVAPAGHDAYAQGYGVPAGRWDAVGAAWHARMRGDWRVGAKIGEALEAAQKKR